jgi:uncharacterized membrane protein YphA (DoxX/SURF4 family)
LSVNSPNLSSVSSSKNNIVRYLTLALQVALAGVFLYSAYAKITDLYTFGEILRSYGIVPDALIKPLAVGVPLLELLFGIGLIIPQTARVSAVVIGLLSMFFMIALVANWGKVLPYGCGCFGPSEAKPVGWLDVGKDVLFLAMAIGIFVLRRK